MIRIGLNAQDKQNVIDGYLKKHDILKGYILYFKKFKPNFNINIDHEYIEYSDIIEYNPFYRLIEEINPKSLLIIDECMRTQNRSDLTYNCAHHYCNQTQHKIVFEYFPIVNDLSNFMILLDFLNKGKYKGKGFNYVMLNDEDIKIKHNKINMDIELINITESQREAYEKRKNELFDNLGNKDPDTIPRNLHLFTGNHKKLNIDVCKNYVARNSRFKLNNVTTYKDIKHDSNINCVLDFPHRRIEFNDFLKTTGCNKFTYINTGLPVDEYYKNDFTQWAERVESFHVKASVYE